ncbi:hypothetical protein JXM67_12255 [candidate division WOR-3 bacterium]|nr:hypothetical protein [candidate division WOR-3 bacterium]
MLKTLGNPLYKQECRFFTTIDIPLWLTGIEKEDGTRYHQPGSKGDWKDLDFHLGGRQCIKPEKKRSNG